MAEPANSPYLLLVTFGAPHLDALEAKHLSMLETWPYDGIALIVRGAYDAGPAPTRGEFGEAATIVRAATNKRVWPWVFSNRFIGQAAGRRHESMPEIEYFRDIRGWDFDDETGALSAFFGTWRSALQLAKDFGAPGVVLDLEAYNDYETYNVDYLAEKCGLTRKDTVARVTEIGREMARIVAQEYPSARLWSLFTHLGTGRTTDHLCQGLLAELKEGDVPASLIDGGEAPLGYYSPSAEALERKLADFAEELRPFQERYPRWLRLGGTIAPYHEPERLTWWIKDASEKGGRTYRSAEEFRPLFDTLFRRCRDVWIYGASAAHYNPFNPNDAVSAAAIHEVLREARDAARR